MQNAQLQGVQPGRNPGSLDEDTALPLTHKQAPHGGGCGMASTTTSPPPFPRGPPSAQRSHKVDAQTPACSPSRKRLIPAKDLQSDRGPRKTERQGEG